MAVDETEGLFAEPIAPIETPRRPRRVAVVAVVVTVAVVAAAGFAVKNRSATATATRPKPNVVVIMTDDQTLEEMKVMDNTRRLLGGDGTTFSHYYVSFPSCCPSRATYLTGQYSHNDHVRDNLPPNGGFHKLDSTETLPVWLQRDGYYTASIGKYLNTWGQDGNIAAPPGWSHWFGLIDPTTYQYFGYSVSNDGKRQDYGHAPTDYSTDVLGGEVVKTIRDASAKNQPFYLSFTPLSPHVESPEKTQLEAHGFSWPFPVPAPRYAGRYADELLPKTPSWNQADVSQSPAFVRSRPQLSPAIERLATKSYQLELETMLATDEWVGKIVQTLKDSGVYDNTVVVFTSDNGLFHGEHRIPNGKVYLYEPDVHLPLIVEGPGFPRGATIDAPTINPDLATTLVALTGATAGVTQDGEDLQTITQHPADFADRGVLLENQLGGKTHSEAIHTQRWFYAEHSTGDIELYDLAADPDQIHNLTGDPRYSAVEANLKTRLAKLRDCQGGTCEGSLASHGTVGTATPDPVNQQASGPTGTTRAPPTTVAMGAKDQINAAVGAIEGNFSITNDERDCVTKALQANPHLLDNGGGPALQNPRIVASVLGVAKDCINHDQFTAGLSQVLALFTGTDLNENQSTCVAQTLTALPTDSFSPALVVLADPRDSRDLSARATLEGVLTGCGVDATKLLGPP